MPRWTLTVLIGFVRCCLGVHSAPAATWELCSDRVERFGMAEVVLRLDEPPSGNPFREVGLLGETRDPEGKTAEVEGFCDDEQGLVHRIRFLATEAGWHSFRVVARVGAWHSEYEGRFLVRAGRRPGIVQVDPDHPRHFRYTGNGRHYFWNGTTAYWLMGWRDERTIRACLERLAALGVNRVRVALSGRTHDGSRWGEPIVQAGDDFQFRLEPWPARFPEDIGHPGYDVTRFNVAHFQRIDRMLAHAAKLGMQVSLIFHLDGRDPGVDPFGKAGMGGPDEQRYYRYAVARFAAHANVMWDLTNEWHLFRDVAWVEKMGTLVRRWDPYRHLMSVHGNAEFPFRASTWADLAMFQSWDEKGGYEFIRRRATESGTGGRVLPVVNEEYGYEDHYPYPWGGARTWPARTADTRRRLAWEITMAGGYQTTGERANVPGQGGWLTGRGNDRMTLLDGYRHMRVFFEKLRWWRLEPREDLLRTAGPAAPSAKPPTANPTPPPVPPLRDEPMLLADPGRLYVVYLPRGGTVSVDLTEGTYRCRWFQPRSGRFMSRGTSVRVEDGAVWASEIAPDAEDWVLCLERKGP